MKPANIVKLYNIFNKILGPGFYLNFDKYTRTWTLCKEDHFCVYQDEDILNLFLNAILEEYDHYGGRAAILLKAIQKHTGKKYSVVLDDTGTAWQLLYKDKIVYTRAGALDTMLESFIIQKLDMKFPQWRNN